MEAPWFDTVDMYNISNDQWTKAPKLNQNRANHSSCVLQNQIYVFCGMTYQKDGAVEPTNTIECLNAIDWVINMQAEWELIQLKSGSISERYQSMVAPISLTQILILGGIFGY